VLEQILQWFSEEISKASPQELIYFWCADDL
jgi:hypothetical protein